jgi:hypothetical protein
MIVIVKKSHVALAHDTARSFLLDRNGGQPLSIDPPSAHGHIAETCLKSLMDQKKDWRRTLTSCKRATFDKHPFLLYAVSSWAYHASQALLAPGLRALVRTFLNKFALVWIYAVALIGDMRIITRTGKSLRALADESLLVGYSDLSVNCIRLSTGAQEWSQRDFSEIDGIARAITVGERHVVFQATWSSDVLYSIIMTGRRTFTVDLGQRDLGQEGR